MGTEHILLCLLRSPAGELADVLSALGLNRASITQSTAENRAKLPKDATEQTDSVTSASETTTVY